MDTYGKFVYRLQLNVFDVNTATGRGNIANIEGRIDALLYDAEFTTTSYAVKYIRHTGWQDVITDYDYQAKKVVHSFTEYVLRVYTKSA